ncbi:MAG TPA: hypothetical protein ENI76_09535 [Ignavibacteria bacterium]|nr:hypothetical protein [Ignavibacteria bacterium]
MGIGYRFKAYLDGRGIVNINVLWIIGINKNTIRIVSGIYDSYNDLYQDLFRHYMPYSSDKKDTENSVNDMLNIMKSKEFVDMYEYVLYEFSIKDIVKLNDLFKNIPDKLISNAIDEITVDKIMLD